MAGSLPDRHVVCGPGDANLRVAVPDRELLHGRVEICSTVERMAHRDACGVAEHLVVLHVRRVRGVHNRRRLLQARLESRNPIGAGRGNRHLHELVGVERQHRLEANAGVEQRLGREDVGARRKRAVREAHVAFVDERADLLFDLALEAWWEATGPSSLVDQMAAEVQHERRGEPVEHGAVDGVRRAHQTELAARHGHGRVVVAGQVGREAERAPRLVDVAEDQRGFGGGCFSPVVVGRARGAVGSYQPIGPSRECAGPFDVARE